MKHAESLNLLHVWATYPAITRMDLPRMVAETEAHGLAAVRAVSRLLYSEGRRPQDPILDAYEAKSEARLAFRAALSAVGIKVL